MHVLILGARAPVCLEWARAFTKAGWRVTVADSLHWPLARISRAVNNFEKLPEPRSNPDKWLNAVMRLVKESKVDLIMPTCEEVFYLSYGYAQLKPLCRIFTSDFDLLHSLHHKGHFAQMTRDWLIKTPETLTLIESGQMTEQFPDPADWVFKPAYSRFASRTMIRPTENQINKIIPSKEAPWVAQRFIEGKEHCSFSILVNGKVRAHACYHPRYRAGKGSGIYFDVTNPAPIQDFVKEFGANTSYTGQVGFDFIEDKNGFFHVLECNPRGTSGIHLFDDQPLSLVNAIDPNGNFDILIPGKDARMISLAMILLSAPMNGWKYDFWRDYSRAHDVIKRDNDFGALLMQLPGVVEIIWRAIHKRSGLLSASTADIEWDGQSLGKP